MSSKRRLYSEEFKSEAVELAEKNGISKAASELGVNPANIRRWRLQDPEGNSNSSGSKTMAELEKELRRLQKENGYLRKINEVLKKSTAIFSNDHIQNSR